jgi:hypothetical protein
MNIYVLNQKTYVSRNNFLKDLEKVMKSGNHFRANIPLTDRTLDEEVAKLFKKHKLFLAMKEPSPRVEQVLNRAGTIAGIAAAEAILHIPIPEPSIAVDTFDTAQEVLGDAAQEAVTQGAEEATQELGELLGFWGKIGIRLVGAGIGYLVSNRAKHYFVRGKLDHSSGQESLMLTAVPKTA